MKEKHQYIYWCDECTKRGVNERATATCHNGDAGVSTRRADLCRQHEDLADWATHKISLPGKRWTFTRGPRYD